MHDFYRIAETRRTPVETRVVTVALGLLTIGAVWLGEAYSWRQGALFLLGGGLGVALYHASFGLTPAWRVFVSDRRGAGLRAQMLMSSRSRVVLFYPVLGHVLAVGLAGPWRRWSRPWSCTSVLLGAFLFGHRHAAGRRACAPRARLFAVGGGNTRMLVDAAVRSSSVRSIADRPTSAGGTTLPALAPTSLTKTRRRARPCIASTWRCSR